MSDPEAESRLDEPTVVRPEKAAPRRNVGRILLWVLLVFFVLLAGAAGGTYWFIKTLPERLRTAIIDKAAERGFTVEFESLTATAILPWESGEPGVALTGVSVTSKDFPGVDVSIDAVTVPLTGTFPSYEPGLITADHVTVRSPTFVALIPVERSAQSGALAKTPVIINDLTIRVKSIADSLPLTLLASVDQISIEGRGLELKKARVEIPVPFVDLALGPTSAEIQRKDGFTRARLDSFPFIWATLDDQAEVLKLELEPIDSSLISTMMKTELPTMKISGSVQANVGGKKAKSGSFSLLLDGYIPPHPKEASGIVFGKQTKLSGNVRVDGLIVYLNDLNVEAGSFKLQGSGSVNFLTGSIELRLRGNIACSELAVSAVSAHLGREAAILTRGLASGRLGGTVGVRVSVDGKLSDIANVKIVPSAMVGCNISL